MSWTRLLKAMLWAGTLVAGLVVFIVSVAFLATLAGPKALVLLLAAAIFVLLTFAHYLSPELSE